jgi:hypothetical protein
MVGEGAPPAARMGVRGTAAAAAKPLPQFLDKRETDTETCCNGRLRGVPGLQGLYNAITEVLRVRSHTSDYALNGPDMQLQAALGVGELAHAATRTSRGHPLKAPLRRSPLPSCGSVSIVARACHAAPGQLYRGRML